MFHVPGWRKVTPQSAVPGPLGRGLLFRAGRAAPIQLAVDEGAI